MSPRPRSSRLAELRARHAELRARLRRRRPVVHRRRRRWPWLVLLVLLLLLLLRFCSCAEPPPEVPEGAAVLSIGTIEVPPAPEPPLPEIERRDRPDFANEAPQPLAWIDAFRLQVAARSPRLAECFVGADQPGALKWTASVEPGSGRVSDHSLDPTLETAPLTSEQRGCVIGVLSDPPYRLEGVGRSTPSRVSMAIEF